jgi:carbamoyltransferase
MTHYSVADLARTGQEHFCALYMSLLRELRKVHPSPNLVLGGGCSLNSSWNGRVIPDSGYDALHIFCAPADDGNAVGAALLAWSEDNPGRPVGRLQTPYLGTPVSGMAERLENVVAYSGYSVRRVKENLEGVVASEIANGKIVGWMQGESEFGPRALGNRSILADPRHPQMKDRINSTVKFREEFRPLAPSILREFVSDYFQKPQESPYMERTLRFRESVVDRVPAVVHVDGTGRLQTVGDEWNPRYRKLIAEFHKITGVPMLLNTSFNVMGKPIVHSIEDAVAVFATSGLDTLVIDNLIVDKPAQSSR